MAVEHMLDAQQQLAQMKRLGNEIGSANLESFKPVLRRAQRSHEHNRQRCFLLNMSGQLKTRTIGQADVEYDQIPKTFAELFQRALLGLGPVNVVFLSLQTLAERSAQRTIIFDQQQSLHSWYARFQRADFRTGRLHSARQRRAYPELQAAQSQPQTLWTRYSENGSFHSFA